jgi:hypothetical protein
MLKSSNQSRKSRRQNNRNKNNNGRQRVVVKGKTQGQTGAWATAHKALQMVQHLTGLINVEYKYFETDNNTTATSNGTLINLCAPQQGTSVIQRDGDSIKMKTLQYTGQLYFPTGTVGVTNNGPEVVRIIIFVDKQNTIGSSGAALLENTGSGSAVRSNLNQDNADDVIILVDDSYAMDQYHPIALFNYVIPVEMHQHFQAGSTTAKTNGLTVALFTQATSLSPSVAAHSHCTYVDN